VLVRTRAAYTPLVGNANERDRPQFIDPVVLVRAPYRLSFSYAGTDRIWRETWQGSNELPKAIKVTLQDATTQRILAASSATLVHADIAPECIAAKSLADCPALRAQTARATAAAPAAGGLR
jgi:general secretion pathway protein J